MTDFSQLVPEYIRRLANQSRPLKQASGNARPILLNLNENPFGPSPKAVQALQQASLEVNRYPDLQAGNLHQEIAAFHDVDLEQVLVTAGASELLCIAARTLLAPGLNAVTSAQSFIVYKLAVQVTEGTLVEVPTLHAGYDLERIALSIDANTRIVFIANPNNPTGSVLSVEEITLFVKRMPGHVLLVLDEAYGDFAEDFAQKRGRRYSCALDYIRQDRNVLWLKTFSKTHGLPGLRVGYGIAPARIVKLLAPLRTVFSISSVGEAAAIAALRDFDHIRRAVENNTQEAERVETGLRQLGFSVPQTWANFFYIDVRQDAAQFAEQLREHGIVGQPLTMWGAPTAIRVTIGRPEENEQFLNAMSVLRG
jgi:histidinol-phosphate aminotransferase